MKQLSLKITILGSILALGCSHSPTKDLLTPDFLLQKGVKQITFQGDNERPRFSAAGNRLIYASRSRPSQKNLQIFETDLIRNKERRVTFSDGDAFDPSYASEMEMIYSSTTDEIKESPFLNRNPSKEFPPADLYMSDRFGADIVRVTNQPGYDGEAILVPDGFKPSVIFTSRRGDVTGIYRLDMKSSFVSLLAAETGKDRRSPTLAPEKSRLAFIETNLESKKQSLQLMDIRTRQTVQLKGGEGQYRDLYFAPRPPSRLFYSILRKGDNQYQLEVYNLESKCTQLVFKGADSLMYPVVSNETKERLAFTRTFQEKKQIYIVDLPDDLGACLPEPVSTDVKAEAAPEAAATPAPKPPVKQKRKAVKAKVAAPAETPAATPTAPAESSTPTSTSTPAPSATPVETPAVKTSPTPAATPPVTTTPSPVPVETPATPAK